MHKRLLFLSIFLVNTLFAQQAHVDVAISYFQEGKYSLAQNLFENIPNSEDAKYYSAVCAKILFASDALDQLNQFLKEYPYSLYRDDVYLLLSDISYRKKEYRNVIRYYKCISQPLNNEHRFKLAYSYFCINSYNEAAYHFSFLIGQKSKFTSTAQYYYAHIAYNKGSYKRALNGFSNLKADSVFSSIVPYYIAQIYFLQGEYRELIKYAVLLEDKVIPSRKLEINRMLAEAHYQLFDYSSAILYFEKYISLKESLDIFDYFQVGYIYHKLSDDLNAIKYLEEIYNGGDSLQQYAAYYLGASYLNLDKKNYALQAFKKAANISYSKKLQDDAFFNYIKLAFELDLPFERTLDLIEDYLQNNNSSPNKDKLKFIMVQMLQETSKYEEAYHALSSIKSPNVEQRRKMQKLIFFLAVKQYNSSDYKSAMSLFQQMKDYPIDEDYIFLSKFWIADCYYQLGDFEKAKEGYMHVSVHSSLNIRDYAVLRKYNLGYCFFQLAEYEQAVQYFRGYLDDSSDSMRIADANLRIGDGLFMQNKFSLAEQYYAAAIGANLFDIDYALYNRSLCLGLIGKEEQKIDLLEDIVKLHRSSPYFDNSLQDLADYFRSNNQLELALSMYDTLLVNTESISLIPATYISKGMIFLNLNEVDKAIRQFQYVVDNYSKTVYFKQALAGLQTAYISIARVDKYLAIVNNLPELSISRAEQDSLTYQTAFIKYNEKEFNVASQAFKNYLVNFPRGIFSNAAHFYIAESYKELDDTVLAVKNYTYLVDNDVQLYLESSLIYLARYYYRLSDYSNSNRYYMKLEDLASTNSMKREVSIRLMYGFKNLDLIRAAEYAEKVIKLDKIDDWLQSQALIIVARKDFQIGNYSKAKFIYEKIREISKNNEGAEAFYMLIYLSYLDEEYERVEQMVFDIAKFYNNDYFIAKAFILLSDVYKNQGNIFQAKATLESIIDNHDGQELVAEARKKWEKLLHNQIKDTSLAVIEQSYIDLNEEINYELLFEQDSILENIFKNE